MIQQVLRELKSQGYAPRTLLDVGAHVGTFTRSFLEVFPDCVPTLIEPNPFCQDDLSKLGFEQHAVAAVDKPGRAPLFLSKAWLQSTGCSLYRENTIFFRDEVVATHDVETRRIDDLFEGRRFDFVKIDTQGAELDVLRGGEIVLQHAYYILVEISLVDYNIGGAQAEATFAQLRAMGFRCGDVTEFHRLANIHNGNLLQMDFLFERRAARPVVGDAIGLANVRAVAASLGAEGRVKDALLLLEFLAVAEPGNAETLRPLAKMLGAEGRTVEALEKLCELKAASADMEALVGPVQEQIPPALKRFNDHIAAGEIAEAENVLSLLVAIIPHNKALLDAALACNLALGRKSSASRYAATLLLVDPAHAAARSAVAEVLAKTGNAPDEIERPVALAPSTKSEIHPLVRLRDIHDAISAILCRPLTARSVECVEDLLKAGRGLVVAVPPGSDWEGWEKHYRLMLDGIDLKTVQGSTPEPRRAPEIRFTTSSGVPANWLGLRAAAARLGSEAVFFAAADQAYVDLYARWYVKSILDHCDVPCLVVLHVIGGADRLQQVAKTVGIRDKRLFFAGDRFDSASVTTHCFDAPPKGKIKKPVAHLQSMRFLRLGSLLQKLQRPVFVSDIDLVLQRGVKDLLARLADADIVLNRNEASKHAGSHLTANLLLVSPTENTNLFLNFLSNCLERQLSKPDVTRWIDQLALLLAHHHLLLRGANPRVSYFDTSRDINNVMYPSYQDNPFTFLSLFHGFDMSSLEGNPKLSGEVQHRKSSKHRVRRSGG